MSDQNLRARSDRLVTDAVLHFRNLVELASTSLDGSASAGGAAYHSMAMQVETDALIKSTEDLLQLTHLLRELWVIGPLRKPGEGEAEAEATIGEEVGNVVTLLNQMRETSRRELIQESAGQKEFGQGSFAVVDNNKGDTAAQAGQR